MNEVMPDGFKMTELGPLPENWKVTKLQDYVIKTKQKDMRKASEKFKYIDVSGIDRESLRIISSTIYQGKEAPSRARKIVKENDVIVATVRPTLKRIALIPKEYDNQVCSTAFCVLRGNDGLSNQFIYYAVQRDSFIDELGKIQRGASYPAVTDSDVKNQKIPHPPLPEQKRIAAVLSTVQSAREKTGAVVQSTRELKKSMMKHLFTYGPVPLEEAENVPLKETEIGMVPEGWDVVKLGEVVEFSKKPREVIIKEQDKLPFISMDMVSETNQLVKGWEMKQYSQITSGTFVFKDDVAIAKITPCFENGKQAILSNLPTDIAYMTTEVWAFHPNQDKEITSEHIFSYLRLPGVRNAIASKMEGATGRQRIPKSVISSVQIPLPPLPEQQHIAAVLSSIDDKIQAEEGKKNAQNDLFKTLLNDLMTAKIRVNGLNIEV
ncbi:MAG: restriction endonuclease subunit S [Thermoplasmata archaeon]|nr:restriction endonuclease subunit S [Thermoplasmata archaeon]